MISSSTEEQIHYLQFNELQNPELNSITWENIEEGFESKEWRRNFETITQLRQANRFYANIFLQELLPKACPHIVLQIDNLRSNNSKEALTLVWEFFEHQNLEKVDAEVIKTLLSALFIKSVCEKHFLKNLALKALNTLPKKYNSNVLGNLSFHTQSNNGLIAELSIKIQCDYMENNKVLDVDSYCLSILAKNIEGKRALLQRKGRQILSSLKKRLGGEKLQEMIKESKDMGQEESSILLHEMKRSDNPGKKTQSNFRDFLKMKKQQ